MTDKQRLAAAFATLRTQGYVARQAFWCCNTCAASAVEDILVESGKDPMTSGAVYYSKEEARNAFAYDGSLHQHGVALQWQGSADDIVGAIEAQGLRVEWEGIPERAIMVYGRG